MGMKMKSARKKRKVLEENGEGESNTSTHKLKRALHEELNVDDGFGMEAMHLITRDDDESNDAHDKNWEYGDPVPSMNENGQLRLRPDIEVHGPEYLGKKTSREQLLLNELSDSLEVESENDYLSSDSGQERGAETAEHQYSADDSDDGMRWQQPKDKDDELEALNKEYEEMEKQEREMLKSLKAQTSIDNAKCEAVKQQKALWDCALEMRILVQKVVINANRLPREKSKLVLCAKADGVQEAYDKLKTSASEALNYLIDLEEALIDQNSAITNAYKNAFKDEGKEVWYPSTDSGEGLDHTWKKLDFLYSRIVPYRDNSVDRWYRKTQITTGVAAMRGRLNAFDKSISQQLSAAMQDPSRLIRKMQLKKSSVHVLGQLSDSTVRHVETGADKAVNKATENQGDDFDSESFDDSEFYQQLLNEFLESSEPGTIGMYAIRRLRNKKRKAVDRRASKGRKVRYNVLEPLVNFMASEPMDLSPMVTKLFSNLFGHFSTGN